MKCSVCSEDIPQLQNLVCPKCGFDESCNIEIYPTLGLIPPKLRKPDPKKLLVANRLELTDVDQAFRGLSITAAAIPKPAAPISPEAELEALRAEAEKGSPDAQYRLAICYIAGTQVPQNDNIAFRWLRKAANNGVPQAQYLLGNALCFGIGTRRSIEEAKKWLRMAEKHKIEAATLRLRELEHEASASQSTHRPAEPPERADISSNTVQAAKNCYHKAATMEARNDPRADAMFRSALDRFLNFGQNGDAEAAYFAGQCYANGKGTAPDLMTAFLWYSKAAASGFPLGQYATGLCYRYGKGVNRDPRAAFQHLQTAAQAGVTAALSEVAKCYTDGFGAPLDWCKAAEWYNRAADKGDVNAMFQLAECRRSGYGVAADQKAAAFLYSRAKNLGSKAAAEALNRINLPDDYVSGKGHGEVVISGSCGVSMNWALHRDGTLLITGSGDMQNYSLVTSPKFSMGTTNLSRLVTSPWDLHRNSITRIIVGRGVLSIGDFAFYGMEKVTSIDLPTGLRVLGDSCVAFCSLRELHIPDGVLSIQRLGQMPLLERISLPGGIRDMQGWNIFASLRVIAFRGSSPTDTSNRAFFDAEATVYYPAADRSWTEESRSRLGNELKWVAV